MPGRRKIYGFKGKLTQLVNTPVPTQVLAHACACSPRTIQDYARQGIISRAPDETDQPMVGYWPLIDSVRAIMHWKEKAFLKRRRTSGNLDQARYEKLQLESEILRKKLSEMEERVAPVGAVLAIWEDCVMSYKGRALSAPARYALKGVGLQNPAEVNEFLKGIIEEILSEFKLYRVDHYFASQFDPGAADPVSPSFKPASDDGSARPPQTVSPRQGATSM